MVLTNISELPELYEGLKEAARHNPRSLRGEIIACPEHHVERLPCWRVGFRLRRHCARGCHVLSTPWWRSMIAREGREP